MKKILSLIFCILLVFSLTCAVFAQSEEADNEVQIENEEDKNEELAIYIKEKIAPIVVGVITSVIALLGAIGSIKKALFSLKDTKDILEIAQCTFKDEFEKIRKETEKVPELKEKFEGLRSEIASVSDELKTIMQILTLAYSSDEKLVKCGKASKMYKLLNEGENDEKPL